MPIISGAFSWKDQPDTLDRVSCHIAWDGRIDNREDLGCRLGKRFSSAAEDSVIALALYLRFGIEGFATVIGDFSLAISDTRTSAVILASDYAGIRPLYYSFGERRLVWGSLLSDVVQRVPHLELDEDYVADFLLTGSSPDRTPYKNIRPVPPGHALHISDLGIRTIPLWQLPVESASDDAGRSDYPDQLLDVFQKSVSARLRSTGPVCVELSGGLDSSSVASMATRLTGSGNLVALNYDYPGSPDSPFVRRMEAFCGVKSVHIPVTSFPFVSRATLHSPAPIWWEPRLDAVLQKMRSLGSHTLLTGQLGDLVMANFHDDSEQVADFLSAHQYRTAFAEARSWSRHLRLPIYKVLWNAMRGTGQDAVATNPAAHEHQYTILSGRLRNLARARVRQRMESAPWRHVRGARRKRLSGLHEMLQTRALQCPYPLLDVSVCHPFADRRLVEFMLRVPPALACQPGKPRNLMRQGFAPLLPTPVLRRHSKASYTSVMRDALRPLALELLSHVPGMLLVERQLIDPAQATRRLERFVNGLDDNSSQLRQMVLLEFWLRGRPTQAVYASANAAAIA